MRSPTALTFGTVHPDVLFAGGDRSQVTSTTVLLVVAIPMELQTIRGKYTTSQIARALRSWVRVLGRRMAIAVPHLRSPYLSLRVLLPSLLL